ncbi:uncharacterized protein LOC107020543 isoform X1 [Solanum pennellii]|uniref:Uncharacterized protein LOC107020543 isoform X1 n=1 Tax=Solanum pennellii TaxID=28526 RepID=A0ABM1GV42_SOLPN|nr:uncharacterized protein LOC107020543 isoform X1 [Solanum pennellii]
MHYFTSLHHAPTIRTICFSLQKLEITKNCDFLLQLRKKLESFWNFLSVLPNRRQASEEVISLPVLVRFLWGNMRIGRGIKRSWGGRGGITNKGGGGSKLRAETSQKGVSESSIPTSQQVGLNQCIVSSHESSSQQIVHTSQEANAQQMTTPENLAGQQEAPTSLDVG